MQLIFALILFLVGILYTIELRGEPFRALRTLHQRTVSSPSGLTPFAALTSALCGTLGVGSISAVTDAVVRGGAGVLLWLWLGALAGCSLKYAEIRITMAHRNSVFSGAMVSLHEKSPFLGYIYAFLCLPVALIGMGNLTQVQVLSDALHTSAHLPRSVLAAGVLLVLGLLLSGGIGRISKVSAAVLPAVGVVYIAVCLYALFLFRSGVPDVLSALLQELTHPLPSAFALGITRGLFLSEAGLGTAAFAHSRSCAPPRLQGALGVCEVLFSTLLATLTALVLLTSGIPLTAAAAMHAFRAAIGSAGDVLLCLMITFYALSTLPVWWFYGRQCILFLCRNRLFDGIYTSLFLLIACIGCLFPLRGTWLFADAANLMLTLPALAMLLLYRKEMRSILSKPTKTVILNSNRKSSFHR